jgi:hypothetical protein
VGHLLPRLGTRIREGNSLMPDHGRRRHGAGVFDELRLPDVPGTQRLGDASGEWFCNLVRAGIA